MHAAPLHGSRGVRAAGLTYPLGVVRRDADRNRAVGRRSAHCASPAGASPALASVGAPGSRPQAAGEIPLARAGRRKLARRFKPRSEEQACGPQHEVKPAASTEAQSGGRADHVTAKATPSARASKRVDGSGGVGGATRVQGEVRNTRGPSPQPVSGRGVSYEPKAKSSVAERESEGAVVVAMPAQNNASGAKGPCGDDAVRTGKGPRRNGLSVSPPGHLRQSRPLSSKSPPYSASLGQHWRGAATPIRFGCFCTGPKPCAGNPHARFERGACPFTDDSHQVKGRDLPMKIREPMVREPLRGSTCEMRA
jgi:hypothetical protein